MTKQQSSLFTLSILLVLIFGVPYLWRKYRDNDIAENSKYAFAQVFKKTGSLKNGNAWHYRFYYGGKLYEGHWSTHNRYDVNIGEYFLVHFSSAHPQHNKIRYDYKLSVHPSIVKDSAWNNLPKHYTKSGLKTAINPKRNGL